MIKRLFLFSTSFAGDEEKNRENGKLLNILHNIAIILTILKVQSLDQKEHVRKGNKIMTKEKLGKLLEQVELPVISAPMFLVSGPDLVIETCKNGVIGSFPLLNARTDDILEEWLITIKKELQKAKHSQTGAKIAPWAVNLIVHRSNHRLEKQMELIKKYQPPIVITSLGNPQGVVEIVQSYGGLVFSDVATLRHAKKAASLGVDGLILVCSGAGGHGGELNPFAFMGAVRKFWNGITCIAGCVTSGRDVLAVRALGADFAYMGTRFIPAEESMASFEYKKMVIESTSDDIIYTDAFSGVKGNYLIPSIKKAGIDPGNIPGKGSLDFSSREGPQAKPWKDIWSAGQGVNSIDKISPVSEIIELLRKEYRQALAGLRFSEEPFQNA